MKDASLRRRGTLALAVAVVLLLCALAWWGLGRSTPRFETLAVSRADVEASVNAIGSLRPRRYVDVGAQVSGQILRLHVQPGDIVDKGKLLVEIDPSVQQSVVDAGRAALAGLRAQLAEQQALQRLADQQLARQRQMAVDGATRDEDLQTAEAELAAAAARIDYLKAQIDQTQATLRAEETRLGFTRIYAPMAGTVVSVQSREGQTLNATYQTPDVLRIADLSVMTVWTEVSEADVRQVKVGQPAGFVTLGADAQDQPRRWTSRVRQLLPAPAEPEGKGEGGSPSPASSGKQAVTYTVLFDVDNSDGELMPQMTAQVSFVTAQARGVLAAPLTALSADANAPGNYTARVMLADGHTETRALRLGVRNRSVAEIVEGLAEGEALVVSEAARAQPQRWLQW